ncbi:unnamed protein product [Orchesella dallaii]|uniref:DOMON domain-containing protein n=1 Tax=Orchesella dallaii TaxID=48710 RepID=A0ABP1S2Z8_9HEXA
MSTMYQPSSVFPCVKLFWFFIISTVVRNVSAYIVDNNPYRHFVTLDQHGKYELEWLVDWDQKSVIFNVTVATKGYVGFGLARKGKMSGADIVIGGVNSRGKPYFTDRHAIGNQLPVIDTSQDWTLHTAWEKGNKTFLSFSRPFDTCDADHDLPITDDTMTIIWSYSEKDDELQYHFQNRGGYDVYILDPDLVPRKIDKVYQKTHRTETTDIRVFQMTRRIVMPVEDTTYWCSFHKTPTSRKNHIVGWRTVLPKESDVRHIHHMTLYRCAAPPGASADSLFEGLYRSGGGECYLLDSPSHLLTQYCKEPIHVWAIGGRAIFFPEHVGLPISESGSDYFMLQTHYDNPNLLPNLKISVTLEAFYTDKLRPNDVGMLQLGQSIPGSTSIVIPPSSLDHVIYGHCAGACTERMIPKGGVKAFAAFLHTHTSGRGVRYLHRRGNEDLKWIANDNNYNSKFQQFRILHEERRILPGDQLLQRCVYDTTDRNGTVVVGGFSTQEEMCTGYMYIYPRSPEFARCRSESRDETYLNRLGIENTTWNQTRRKMVITSPTQFAGLSVNDYVNNFIEWDIETRKAFQREHKLSPQISQCPRFTSSISVPQRALNLQGRLERGTSLRDTVRVRGFVAPTKNTIIDSDFEHVSINPIGILQYKQAPQCLRDLRKKTLRKN